MEFDHEKEGLSYCDFLLQKQNDKKDNHNSCCFSFFSLKPQAKITLQALIPKPSVIYPWDFIGEVIFWRLYVSNNFCCFTFGLSALDSNLYLGSNSQTIWKYWWNFICQAAVSHTRKTTLTDLVFLFICP